MLPIEVRTLKENPSLGYGDMRAGDVCREDLLASQSSSMDLKRVGSLYTRLRRNVQPLRRQERN
jgi:hypothetical protein